MIMQERTMFAKTRRYGPLVAAGLFLAGSTCAEPLWGRAIAASLRGDVVVESEAGTEALEEGMALTQGHLIRTERDSSLCTVLTPGALVCVDESSELALDRLQHVTEGLPADDKSPMRRIALTLRKGAILLYAGESIAGRSITVTIPAGVSMEASGGRFILGVGKDAHHIYVEEGEAVVTSGGESQTVGAGNLVTFNVQRQGDTVTLTRSVEARDDPGLPYDFHVCRSYFPSLAPMTFDWEWNNMGQLSDWIEPSPGILLLGSPRDWQDVSPSVRRGGESRYRSVALPPSGPAVDGQRTRPEIWDWYRRVGTLRGVNYIPRTAVNTIDMWQASTFDPETIDQEMAWASAVDLNSVRVFLPYAVWADDADGLKERIDHFLDIANKHAMNTVMVLFDDRQAADVVPRIGPQPEPVAGRHNSRWTASPGHDKVPESAGHWPQLKAYVQDIIGALDDDSRVLMWDLYNEPGQSGAGNASLPLLSAAFEWARAVRPDQPVTAGLGTDLDLGSRRRIMGLSDVITLAGYESAEAMRAMLALASTRGRPVICTGWLRRRQGNTFNDVLPVFSEFRAGWYHWGLVKGRSQMYLPWGDAEGSAAVWEQDLLEADGSPHNEEEIRLIRGFSFDDL